MGAVIAAPARTELALGEKELAVEERKRALKVKMRCWGRGRRQKTRREKELAGENELREARGGEGVQIKGIQNKSVGNTAAVRKRNEV